MEPDNLCGYTFADDGAYSAGSIGGKYFYMDDGPMAYEGRPPRFTSDLPGITGKTANNEYEPIASRNYPRPPVRMTSSKDYEECRDCGYTQEYFTPSCDEVNTEVPFVYCRNFEREEKEPSLKEVSSFIRKVILKNLRWIYGKDSLEDLAQIYVHDLDSKYSGHYKFMVSLPSYWNSRLKTANVNRLEVVKAMIESSPSVLSPSIQYELDDDNPYFPGSYDPNGFIVGDIMPTLDRRFSQFRLNEGLNKVGDNPIYVPLREKVFNIAYDSLKHTSLVWKKIGEVLLRAGSSALGWMGNIKAEPSLKKGQNPVSEQRGEKPGLVERILDVILYENDKKN